MEPDEMDALRELGPIPNRKAPSYNELYEALPCRMCKQEDEWTYTHCEQTCQRLVDWYLRHNALDPKDY